MSTISERILEQWLQEIIRSSSSSPSPPLDNVRNNHPPPYHHHANAFNAFNALLTRSSRNPFRNEEEEEQHTSTSTTAAQIRFPEYDESMYRYHRNIADYQHVMLQMMDCLDANRRLPARQQTAILDNMVYPFNRNMQEYNAIMRQSLEMLCELHRQPSSSSSSNGGRPVMVTRPTMTTTTTMGPPSGPSGPSGPSEMQEIYAMLPFMRYLHVPEISRVNLSPPPPPPPSSLNPNATRRLTPDQIQLATRNYVYAPPLHATTTPPICAISLEEFRNGDSITQIQPCRHEFRTEFLNRWFQRDARCPVCRCNLWDVSFHDTADVSLSSMPLPLPLVESYDGAGAPRMLPRTYRNRAMSEPHVLFRPEVDVLGTTMRRGGFTSDVTAAQPPPGSSSLEIQQWLHTLLNRRSGFSNMDVDITYTVEYDVSMNRMSGGV